MGRFFAVTHKELLLLRRDRTGLLVLFVMPAVLVLVITLVQENVMKTMGQSAAEILFIDRDQGAVGRQLEKALSGAEGVKLIKALRGEVPDTRTALDAVARGRFQFCLVVPEDLTAEVRSNARRAAMQALYPDGGPDDASSSVSELEVYFDPTVTGALRSAVGHLLQVLVIQIEVQEKMDQLSQLLPDRFRESLITAVGPMAAEMPPVSFDLQWQSRPLLKINSSSALGSAAVRTPNAVQQNVPAWSLFGIFFIVLPMAGSFVKERLSGVEHRMRTMPVSYLIVVGGKVCAYLLVTLVQFGLILLIGKWLLPVLGTAPFELGAAPAAVAVVALCAALAATGYGILLGTLVKSYEQASMFGPISIVIAAAIGGIMVPVYAMPALMQKISVVSPLAWAQNAFMDLLVRGSAFRDVLPSVALLLLFAAVCVGLSWGLFNRALRKGTA